MGIQDRDYYREWWRKRHLDEGQAAVAEPEDVPIVERRSRPNPLHPFVAWLVLIGWLTFFLVCIVKMLVR